ncbi:MAG: hypothetical protein WDN28_12710 [Chthoniobacter sp.]
MQKGLDESLAPATSPANPADAALQRAATFAPASVGVSLPWNRATDGVARAIAQLLGEWPEGRALALHVYENIPVTSYGARRLDPLHRANLALELHAAEKARTALRDWLSWRIAPRGRSSARMLPSNSPPWMR